MFKFANEKRIPFSFFDFKSEVRKTKNEFVFRFSFANFKTKKGKDGIYTDRDNRGSYGPLRRAQMSWKGVSTERHATRYYARMTQRVRGPL